MGKPSPAPVERVSSRMAELKAALPPERFDALERRYLDLRTQLSEAPKPALPELARRIQALEEDLARP